MVLQSLIPYNYIPNTGMLVYSMLRTVALKSWNQENSWKITGTKRGYTPSITEDALSELKGLEQPDPPLLNSSFTSLFHQPSKAFQLIADRHGCRGKN